jgi:hypothetical protein
VIAFLSALCGEITRRRARRFWAAEGMQKWYRNFLVGSTIVETLEKLHLKWPKCDLSGVQVE